MVHIVIPNSTGSGDLPLQSSAAGSVLDGSHANLVYESLLSQRLDAETSGDFEAYVAIEEKLQQLEEYEVQRLEREARKLEAEVRIAQAQQHLRQFHTAEQSTPSTLTSEHG
jgi:hypothetical protein